MGDGCGPARLLPWGIDVIHDNLEVAILVIVAVSVLPMVLEFVRHRSATKTVLAETEEALEDFRDDRA